MASRQVPNVASSDTKAQPQNGAQVTLANQTPSMMRLDRSISWSGTPATCFPVDIRADSIISFSHLSDGNFGSRGAVVYSGTNRANLPCAWVLAWDAPAESSQSPNKVYVTCGSKSIIDRIDFNQIRLSLGESSDRSIDTNPTFKTSADAYIHENVPDKATVGATFSLIL